MPERHIAQPSLERRILQHVFAARVGQNRAFLEPVVDVSYLRARFPFGRGWREDFFRTQVEIEKESALCRNRKLCEIPSERNRTRRLSFCVRNRERVFARVGAERDFSEIFELPARRLRRVVGNRKAHAADVGGCRNEKLVRQNEGHRNRFRIFEIGLEAHRRVVEPLQFERSAVLEFELRRIFVGGFARNYFAFFPVGGEVELGERALQVGKEQARNVFCLGETDRRADCRKVFAANEVERPPLLVIGLRFEQRRVVNRRWSSFRTRAENLRRCGKNCEQLQCFRYAHKGKQTQKNRNVNRMRSPPDAKKKLRA